MTLFEEYAASFACGERPDLRAYLERAGEGSEELASIVDTWLRITPAPAPGAEVVEETRAWLAGEPPLLGLRTRRGLTRKAVVEAIIERCRLPRGKRAKVGRYYHEVETGQLPPTPRVREALAAILGTPVRAWKPRPLEAAPAYFRTDAPAAAQPPAPAEGEWDEIDELFNPAT